MIVRGPALDKAAELLARAAGGAASGPDLAQGAGGNVSVKTGDGLMLVKASGFRLGDVTPAKGWALVNYANIKRRVAAGTGGEAEFSDYILSQALPLAGLPPARPSIETGFHALLNTVVIHIHSVYANVLNMSEEGHKLGRDLFPEAEFLPYRAPGTQLCAAISERARPAGPQIFFLANHGLVTTHAETEGALELNARVNERIKSGLGLPPFRPAGGNSGLSPDNAALLARYGREFLLSKVLSPDQALYCGPEALDGRCGEAENEVLAALFYILDCIEGLGLRPRFLTGQETSYFEALKGGRYSRK
ncbi:MAG: class II aldolase/adducin family protein [Elusimicrobiales bacterium]